MKVTALAGGIGGAKLVNGLMKVLPRSDFAVIVNTGDDFFYSGLYITPDIDSVIYTCAGINNPKTGWGINDETWNVQSALKALGHPVWFNLGDKDLATHIERTRLLEIGWSLTEITSVLAERYHVTHPVYPMTDSQVSTILVTQELGVIPFQEYFVKHSCEPVINKIIFNGVEKANLPQAAMEHLQVSDLVIFAPSNPFVSIGPILAIPGVMDVLKEKTVIAISPLIGGQAIKGPASKMMKELGYDPGCTGIAKFYQTIIDGLVIDSKDQDETEEIFQCGIIPYVEDIFMPDPESQVKLAKKTLELSIRLMREKRK